MIEEQPHEEPESLPPVRMTACWRCELPMLADAAVCPHCAARSRTFSVVSPPLSNRAWDEMWPLKALLIAFGVQLVTGIVHAWTMNARFGGEDRLTDDLRTLAWVQIVFVEAIDTLVVTAAYTMLARRGAVRLRDDRGNAWVGLAALPGLAIFLALNFFYLRVLRDFVHLPIVEDDLLETPTWLTFVAICIQPALVEELFCRGLAIGVLRGLVGAHGAVWIAAVMFGLMHLSAFVSIPYLILLGAFFGYVRLGTGGVWTPMALHFLHNLAVLVYEWK